jgi:hypothetical protein
MKETERSEVFFEKDPVTGSEYKEREMEGQRTFCVHEGDPGALVFAEVVEEVGYQVRRVQDGCYVAPDSVAVWSAAGIVCSHPYFLLRPRTLIRTAPGWVKRAYRRRGIRRLVVKSDVADRKDDDFVESSREMAARFAYELDRRDVMARVASAEEIAIRRVSIMPPLWVVFSGQRGSLHLLCQSHLFWPQNEGWQCQPLQRTQLNPGVGVRVRGVNFPVTDDRVVAWLENRVDGDHVTL